MSRCTGSVSVLPSGNYRARLVVDGQRRSVGFASSREEALAMLTAAQDRVAAGLDAQWPPPPVVESRSFVYFIQDGDATGPIKIGRTVNPVKRLLFLQVGAARRLRLLGSVPGGKELEATLHAAFVGARLNGEWFEPTEKLLALVAELVAIWPNPPPLTKTHEATP